jgi:hypothetical protein
LFELASFVRSTAFALFFAGIEYRYVNRRDAEWTKTSEAFLEKPALWKLMPYHLFFVLPVFVISAYDLPITVWAGNVLWIMVLEDLAYFVWRGRWVMAGEWTTTLLGGFRVGKYVVPGWWIPWIVLALVLYWVPF